MKPILIVDLCYGDSGKGTIVDSLVQHYNAKLVVRSNGAFQAAHNVYQEGINHTFSQFGSGTFSGAHTLITRDMIINPLCMQAEAEVLEKKGIKDPLSLISINRSCVITTPYHRALNQVRELSRRRNHGSTGTGIGETRHISLTNGSLTLRVDDLAKDMRYKLDQIAEYCFTECYKLMYDYDVKGPEFEEAIQPFYVKDGYKILKERYMDWYSKVKVLSADQVIDKLHKIEGHVIFESAQGVLLDQLHGFHPYTTWSNTTTSDALRLLSYVPDHPQPYTIGITRTFATRHGAGPLVTESEDCKALIEDDDNSHGTFQGSMRVGHLDLMTLKYAIKKNRIDGLAVTHCDKLANHQTNRICTSYEGADLLNYNCEVEAGREALEFTQAYLETKPVLTEVKDVIGFLEKELAVPVVIQSSGKLTKEKKYYGITNS